jgi:hypothetical protein
LIDDADARQPQFSPTLQSLHAVELCRLRVEEGGGETRYHTTSKCSNQKYFLVQFRPGRGLLSRLIDERGLVCVLEFTRTLVIHTSGSRQSIMFIREKLV